jgi:hypothetical protein
MDEVYETIVKRYLVNYYNEIVELKHNDMLDSEREEAMQAVDERYCAALLKDLGVITVHP